jgi:hypothetical protein
MGLGSDKKVAIDYGVQVVIDNSNCDIGQPKFRSYITIYSYVDTAKYFPNDIQIAAPVAMEIRL